MMTVEVKATVPRVEARRDRVNDSFRLEGRPARMRKVVASERIGHEFGAPGPFRFVVDVSLK